MRTRYSRVFQTNSDLLAQMLVLRLSGWSYHALQELYGVDRTSVRHWCVKFNIQPRLPETKITKQMKKETIVVAHLRPVHELRQVYKYDYLFEEDAVVNPGKSYKEYIAEHKKRDPSYKFSVNPYANNTENNI